MNVNKIYQEFLDVVNRNSTYKGSPVTKRQFVDLYNNVSISYITRLLKNRNIDDLRYLQDLRKSSALSKSDIEDKYTSFSFPKDYLSFITVFSEFGKGKCTLSSTHLEEIKPEEIEIYYNDSNTEPDFNFGESIYTMIDGKLFIYKKGFDVNKAVLVYYKIPDRIDIKGYKKANGSDSVDISPSDLPDNMILNIIIEMSSKFIRSVENTTQWQMLNSKK